MCGITGIFDTTGTRDFDAALVVRMNDSQFHRGPDEGGVHREPGVALGHRRLSIIDLASGQQPLFNEDHSVVVVFNGEIYNFQEIVPELTALGHVFRTHSDTEVIVHAWEAWGEACVQRFRGMFAFALWDRNQGKFFCARDRFGVKPFYYAFLDSGEFVFGSELKSLMAHPGLPRAVDLFAVEEYFAYGYVPEPRSIFKGVHKLPGGFTLTLERGKARPVPQQYWDMPFTPVAVKNEADAEAELVERLQESIRLRMIADVPLGAFLSGGVDSSAVVAMMAGVSAIQNKVGAGVSAIQNNAGAGVSAIQNKAGAVVSAIQNEQGAGVAAHADTPRPVTTCSIGFTDPAFNEIEFAQTVADRYHTDHHVETVDADDFSLVDKLATVYDEPYADSSALPTYRVCELARKHVKVALSGDGGDEHFAGYRRYRWFRYEETLRSKLPLGLRRPLFGTLGKLYPKADWAPKVFRAKTTFEALARDTVAGYFHGVSLLSDAQRARLFTPAFKRELQGYTADEVLRRHAEVAPTADPLSLVQYLDMKTYLVGDILTKVDRASMAHALEVREPLLDHELMGWVSGLPTDLKLRGTEGKYLLKKAMEPYLPHDVLYRKKMGFSVPLAAWFRGPLAETIRRVVLGERLLGTGWFERGYLAEILADHQSGRRDYSVILWTTLMFDAFLGQVLGLDEGARLAA